MKKANIKIDAIILVVMLNIIIVTSCLSIESEEARKAAELDSIENLLTIELNDLLIKGKFELLSDQYYYESIDTKLTDRINKAQEIAVFELKSNTQRSSCSFFLLAATLESLKMSLHKLRVCFGSGCRKNELDLEVGVFNGKAIELARKIDGCRGLKNN
ncbi:MAG: hypothetical protein OEZ68_00650 [Gammaproteobacteria bacterium]|nr:hypothetical protein [Gammaproteobacteria bacterium]MDH5799287.1 hypothetical protein [Gammaproteobacteria bacterium]